MEGTLCRRPVLRVSPEGGSGSPTDADLEGLEGGLFAMIVGVHRAVRGGTTFELVRTQIPQRGVQTAGVVPSFQILKDGHACFGLGLGTNAGR